MIMKRFDIAPFALPNSPDGEVRFEEARDVEAVEVVFAGPAPHLARLQYMRKVWPHARFELTEDMDQVEVGGQSASPRPPWPPVSWGRREPLLLRYWVVVVVAEVVVEEEVRVRKRRKKIM